MAEQRASQLAFVACPLCGQHRRFLNVCSPRNDRHLAKYGDLYAGSDKSGWKICGGCGFVHQNPRPTVEALNAFYLDARYHSEAPQQSPLAHEYLDFARGYYAEKIQWALDKSGLKSGAVFDVGFGRGGVLKLFQEKNWRIHGVEPDPNLFAAARRLIGDVEIRNSLLDNSIRLSRPVDLVFSNHTFEHVADLDALMRGINRILKPGGHLFTCVPTYYKNRSNMSRLWMNAAHYSLFDHHSLNQLCARHGLEPVSHTYRGWRREIDDVWHLARFTGRNSDPSRHYESPLRVACYINGINPLRSAVMWPVYSNYPRRLEALKAVAGACKLLVTSPRRFLAKVANHLTRR